MSAAVFAAEAHSTQKRKMSEEPYINHLLRVGDQSAKAGLSLEAVAAAILHDVVEDTSCTIDKLSQHFPERTVHLVHLLTQTWSDHASSEVKKAKKPSYYQGILGDVEAIQIKLLDRADNLRDMIRILPKATRWAENYYKSTESEMTPLFRICQNEYVRRAYSHALSDLRKELVK
jgi:GTP pyrophosphokinase